MSFNRRSFTVPAVAAGLVGSWILIGEVAGGGKRGTPLPIPATNEDFFQPGTQPGTLENPILGATNCTFCHANYDIDAEPYRPWAASMPGQSARDPMFWAQLAIANQDVEGAGQFCMRCHVPVAFLEGRTDPPDGSALLPVDFEGVTCTVCHRMVDPVYQPGISPVEDQAILAELEIDGLIPLEGSNARYIIDPMDSRRGPFEDVPFNPHFGAPQPPMLVSPIHQSSEMCWTCHDVSNPLVTRQPDGSYALNALGAAHETASQDDMFPLHRTYREWQNSYYKTLGGVQHNGRFGGNHPTGIMHTCQDCHLPDQEGSGCGMGPPFPVRPDVPQHSFIGANTWVLGAVRSLFPDAATGLSAESVAAAKARNIDMLEKASDLEVTQAQSIITTRITNQSGHKLPTGFPDGRRMWINVKFLDAGGGLLSERGAYDFDTAELLADGADTTVYECRMGLTADQAALTGLAEGNTFHFVLANEILKDNRIPTRGWAISIAEQDQSEPVGETYVSGQHWHDTVFTIPANAAEAVVTVYFQLTSKEFVTFLRDTNVTNDDGQTAYDAWVAQGMSQPVVMDMVSLDLLNPADVDADGDVDFQDLLYVLGYWGNCQSVICPMDIDKDGVVGLLDLLQVLSHFGS
jgi:hypothetical protein